MKTYCINLPKPSLKSIFGFFSFILLSSCGTYQNSSFYDTDGIYGSSDSRVRKQVTSNESSVVYQSYFNSLQKENDSNQIFTDIDSYNNYDVNSNANSNAITGNPGWGGNSQNISINYFPNNFGMDWGFGWGMPFNRWGWGMPFNNWGWGMPLGYWNTLNFGWGFGGFGGFWDNGFYNNWGWGYPIYGNTNVMNSRYNYNSSRRGSTYSNYNSTSPNIGRISSMDNNINTNRGYYDRGNYSGNFNRNEINTSSTPNFNRNTFQNRANTDQYNRENNPSRSNNTRPERRSTPVNNDSYSPSRSMNSDYGNSGGNFGGGGGGGRSSGGGGRRGG